MRIKKFPPNVDYLIKAFDVLDNREKIVFYQRFLMNNSLAIVAESFAVSPMTIKKYEDELIIKLENAWKH